MRWPWRRQARKVEPRQAVSIRAQELETAKEILVEVFHARPSEVEEMIPRLEKRRCIWIWGLRNAGYCHCAGILVP